MDFFTLSTRGVFRAQDGGGGTLGWDCATMSSDIGRRERTLAACAVPTVPQAPA